MNNDLSSAYREKFTAPLPNPIGEPSAWWGPAPHWRGVKALEWIIARESPLYLYLQAPMTLDEPVKCKFRMFLNDGSIKAIMTQKQLERAARVIYGIQP